MKRSDGTNGNAALARWRGEGTARRAAILLAMVWGMGGLVCEGEVVEFTRMLAHWADYSDPGYLPFIEDAKPELVQVGFYGAHFWGLVDTPHGGGYPAHLPVTGYGPGVEWFKRLNTELHKRGSKVVGHINVKFLVGDPESAEGPRGFFRFYETGWDSKLLGERPAVDAVELLERDGAGRLISGNSYSIGGMREYWACLNNPSWREILKAWVRHGIEQGLDGFVVNYFYRHDCHCRYCVAGFRKYLGERFSSEDLRERLAIEDLATHQFEEIGSWHDPAESSLLRREALRFSQMANKEAFDEVFVKFGRGLKPDLILAQWNHLGDFSQINGDERCLLPSELWARDEDYLWYSTGGAANSTDLAAGVLGEGTLQARYIRGASGDKPYTLGKYESVRIRTAIGELAANGGAPMGFYTAFKDPAARKEIVRYYGFLRRHDHLYRGNRSHAELLLLFPRSRVHAGDVAAVTKFKQVGRVLLDEHVLFDVLPDDLSDGEAKAGYGQVIAVTDAEVEPAAFRRRLFQGRSRFDAPARVRVSASLSVDNRHLAIHFVNYDRHEPEEGAAATIEQERPIATPEFPAEFSVPAGFVVERVEFLTPEEVLARPVEFETEGRRVRCRIPAFLVYGVLRARLAREVGGGG